MAVEAIPVAHEDMGAIPCTGSRRNRFYTIFMKASCKAAIVKATLFLVIPAAGAMAQDLEKNIFGPTEEIRLQAEQADAALLSPGAYLKGIKNFDRAKRDFANDEDPDRVRKRLAKASEDFRSARENSEVAKLTLAAGIEGRRAAQEAEATRLAASDWNAAEKTFNAAVLALERDNAKAAQKKHDEATVQFRTAELNAIRTLVLAEAWQLIAEVRQKKIEEFVPQTLGRAERLAKHANDLIIEDRYALDEPLAVADRAIYEARHALYIATLASRIEQEESSVEALILDWESSLDDNAMAANIEPDFSVGPEESSAGIIILLEEIPGLRSDLKDRDALIVDLEEEIRELDAAYGGASADRSRLIRRLEQQARVREQFRQVENMFTNSEAVVLRDGNHLIVRLVGLNFASNSVELRQNTEALLIKVQSAIDVFPQCALTVEGHTDAQGNASRNLTLSEERAQAVKTYMTDVMRIPAFRINALGYGDTRPIASNKTDAGRARNRRIDLIIAPEELFLP